MWSWFRKAKPTKSEPKREPREYLLTQSFQAIPRDESSPRPSPPAPPPKAPAKPAMTDEERNELLLDLLKRYQKRREKKAFEQIFAMVQPFMRGLESRLSA